MATDDLIARLAAAIDEDERVAKRASMAPVSGSWRYDRETFTLNTADGRYNIAARSREGGDAPLCDVDGEHMERWDPANVLRGCAADRKLIAEVTSWKHFYLDEDNWFSCGLAVDPDEPDGEPGSGCANDAKAGDHCDCGLESRQLRILGPLAERYGLEVASG